MEHEGGNIQRTCAIILAANALHQQYGYQSRQQTGTTIH